VSGHRPEGKRRFWGPPWTWWKIAGIVVSAVVAIGGLAVLAFVIVLTVGMSQFGSNK
jgi:hypothetical protein